METYAQQTSFSFSTRLIQSRSNFVRVHLAISNQIDGVRESGIVFRDHSRDKKGEECKEENGDSGLHCGGICVGW